MSLNIFNKKLQPPIFRLARIINKVPGIDENLSVCISRNIFNIDCVNFVVTILVTILIATQFYMPLPVICSFYYLALPGAFGIVWEFHNSDYPAKMYKKWATSYSVCRKEFIRDIVETTILTILLILPAIMCVIYYNQIL